MDDLRRIAVEEARREEIQRHAKDFLSAEWSMSSFRDLIDQNDGGVFPLELWRQVVDLGWPAALLPQSEGGSDSSLSVFCGLQEELGRALLPLPLASTALGLRFQSGLKNLDHIVRQIVSDGLVCTPIIVEPSLGVDSEPILAEPASADEFSLRGKRTWVGYGREADYLLVCSRLPGGVDAIFVTSADIPGISRSALCLMDWSPSAEVTFENAIVQIDLLVAKGSEAESAIQDILSCNRLAVCAEILGVAHRAQELAVAYAKERIAFGRPIGAFQAVKHRLVDLLSIIEIARALTHTAAYEADKASANRFTAVSMAALWARDALRSVPEGALQVFGGIGYTWDHDIHLFLRRGATLAAYLGDGDYFAEDIARSLERGG